MARKRSLSDIEFVKAEAGYRCAVPNCRALTPLDVHHIRELSKGGSNDVQNLICLCPNCHNRYHRESIPSEDVMMAWKIRLQELSRAVDRTAIDVLIYLHPNSMLTLSGDKVADLAALFNAGYLQAAYHSGQGQIISNIGAVPAPHYRVTLTEKGKKFVEAWQCGKLEAVPGVSTESS